MENRDHENGLLVSYDRKFLCISPPYNEISLYMYNVHTVRVSWVREGVGEPDKASIRKLLLTVQYTRLMALFNNSGLTPLCDALHRFGNVCP